MSNKVKYGLSEVHFCPITATATDGTPTYSSTVYEWPGAVNLSMSANGDQSTFRADNTDYWITSANNGYEGTLETALIPDDFRTEILGEVTDSTTGYVREVNTADTVEFALMFQFEGDANATRHMFYRCTASRPDVASQTTGDTIEPQTETINIRAIARIDNGYVKARCEEDATGYSTFFDAVV